jgi:membrane protease YdiL (CAAX protease family)
MSSTHDSRALPAYLILTFAFSAIFYSLIATGGGGGLVDYIGCLMWCPALAALTACVYLRRSVATIAWQWGESRWELAAYLLPIAYALVTYVPAWIAGIWISGIAGFPSRPFLAVVSKDLGFALPEWATIAVYFAFTATIAVIKDLATVLGEEIGWRGFLVPELARRHSFTRTALISGVIWAVWHYPLLLLGGYRSPTPVWFYLPVFTVNVIAINFLWTWVRLKSGSIWPCVVLHAAHNTFIQRFFDPLTVSGRSTPYILGEFGIALTPVAILLALYCWRRRDEVESHRPA